MALFKCTMIFDGPKHGWTESHWNNFASADYGAMMTDFKVRAIDRAACMGKECSIIGLRVSQEGIRNDAWSISVSYRGASQWTCDEPDASLLIRFSDLALRRHKNLFMRGIPDDIDVNFGQYSPVAAGFNVAINTYLEGLFNSNYGWYGTPIAGPNRSNINQYTQLENGHIRFVTELPIQGALAVGTKITIHGTGINKPNKSVLNSAMVVNIFAATTYETVMPYGVLPYTGGGILSYTPLEFIDYQVGYPQRIVTRRVGAPLLASRGRARVRAKG
jgi:hypothetical protein